MMNKILSNLVRLLKILLLPRLTRYPLGSRKNPIYRSRDYDYEGAKDG